MSFQKTVAIVNPHAHSGRALPAWQAVEPLLKTTFKHDVTVAVTSQPDEVADHLQRARQAGRVRVIAVGGDGTNHSVINAILKLQPDPAEMVFGHLPLGTGQDFARSLNIPKAPQDAIRWLAQAQPRPMDVGRVDYDGSTRYFLNSASVGISGAITERINATLQRRIWTFWLATAQTIFQYTPPDVTVHLDQQLWYSGNSWVIVVANGRFFGRGMHIAPYAKLDDGLYDVILAHGFSRLTALHAFNTIYAGTHLRRDDVQFQQSSQVEIRANGHGIPFELDGEHGRGHHLAFQIVPRALHVLQAAP